MSLARFSASVVISFTSGSEDTFLIFSKYHAIDLLFRSRFWIVSWSINSVSHNLLIKVFEFCSEFWSGHAEASAWIVSAIRTDLVMADHVF